jgi:hypothetical protein
VGPVLDTSSVEPLEIPRKRAREEARQEFQNGLRSVNEYRPLAKLEPVDSAYARALWISPAKAPIPATPADAAELGVAGPDGQPAGGVGPDGQPLPEDGGTAVEAVAEARDELGLTETPVMPDQDAVGAAEGAVDEAREAIDATLPGPAAAAVAQASGGTDGALVEGDAAEAVEQARLERKSMLIEHSPVVYAMPAATTDRARLALAAALDAILTRQLGVLTARLESPKTRRGTRFWNADGDADPHAGDAPLDIDQVMQADRWVTEVIETLAPVVHQAAADTAACLLDDMAVGGHLAGTIGGPATGDHSHVAANLTGPLTMSALAVADGRMRGWLDQVLTGLSGAAANADDTAELTAHVQRTYLAGAREFADSLADELAHATVAGAAQLAVQALTPFPGTDAPLLMLAGDTTVSATAGSRYLLRADL